MPGSKPMTIQKASNVHEEPRFMKELNRIVGKEADALNKNEKAFLRARASYLTEDQKETFKEALKVKKVAKKK